MARKLLYVFFVTYIIGAVVAMCLAACGPPAVQQAESASVTIVELSRYPMLYRVTDNERGVTCYVGDEWGKCFGGE